jgi:hypothetical protein
MPYGARHCFAQVPGRDGAPVCELQGKGGIVIEVAAGGALGRVQCRENRAPPAGQQTYSFL